MLKDDQSAEIVPGLRLDEYDQALEAVKRQADRSNRGLFFAWQNTQPRALGFCYLLEMGATMVSIHAKAPVLYKPFEFRCGFSAAWEQHDAFIEDHLRTAAHYVGMSFVDLVNFLAVDRLWEFIAFVDGGTRHHYASDNSSAWQSLWGRLTEIAARGEPVIGGLPADDHQFVLQALLHFPRNGQSWLDR